MPGNPGLQTGDRRGEARQNREHRRRAGTSKCSRTSSTRPTAPRKDPTAGPTGSVVTAQQFYLTDTPCSSSGSTTRAEITADHVLHNTLGTCSNGLQTGSNRGAPDALLTGAPPDPDPEDENNPLLYDYSKDFYLFPGLAIRRDDTNGCHYVPSGISTPQAQVHRWVTDPMASNFRMTKNATIEFYTRALNDELTTGQVCVYLFKRHEVGSPPVATDTLLVDAKKVSHPYWVLRAVDGQSAVLAPVRMGTDPADDVVHLEPLYDPAGDRIGVALSVEKNGTRGPQYRSCTTIPSTRPGSRSTPIRR